MGQGKIPWYSHNKFPRYDIKESDEPEESDLFPLDDDQICHSRDIEWAIELLYNSVETGSQLVWRPVWRADPLVTRCSRES